MRSILIRTGCCIGLATSLVLSAPLVAGARSAVPANRSTCPAKPGKATHRVVTGSSATVIELGIKGGNIRPWSAAIHGDGTIESSGWVTPTNKHLTDTTNALAGLITLADSTGFFSLPPTTQCSGVLPDIASRYITMTTTSGTRTVQVHGGCSAGFVQLWAVLSSIVGIYP